MSSFLNPTILSIILQKHSMIEDSNWNSSWENCDTNLALKDRKTEK